MRRKIVYCILLIFIIFVSVTAGNCLKKDTVAIIGAMNVEISAVSDELSNSKSELINNFNITKGKIGKYNVILSKSGVGKVNSASTTQFIIDKYKPKYIVNIGIAGSLSKDLHTGDIVIAEKMVQHDFDLTAFGNPKGYIDTEIEPDKPTFFYSDKNLVNSVKSKLDKGKYKIIVGTIATGDIFVKDISQKNKIRDAFNADAIDMESASIAQTAQRNNIPTIVIRIISDEKNDTTKEYFSNKLVTAQQLALEMVSILKTNAIR